MKTNPTRIYTAVSGIFLLLQGVSTLTARLYPPFDRAFPALLAVTQMVPPHSVLHIFTGVLAIVVLMRGVEHGAFWFAAGFGLYYTALATYGMLTMQATIFKLQPFDHPFHYLLGIAGLLTAGIQHYRASKQEPKP